MSEKRRHSVSEQWHEAAAADGRVSGVSGTSGAADASSMASYGRSARGDAAGAENSGDDVSGFGAPTSAAAAGRGHASETPASGRDNVPGDAETPRPKRPSWIERNVAQVLSGNILTRAEVRRMYPYVLFIAVLMFLYIANGYHIQKLHRRHDRISEQIKELRSRSLTLSSIRMTATRQSEIIKELEARGIPLQESLTPPKIIDK